MGAIAPRLEQAEIERAKRKPTASLSAYDGFLRGMAGWHDWTRSGHDAALKSILSRDRARSDLCKAAFARRRLLSDAQVERVDS